MGEQFDASRPIYAQLVERLKARILAGTYPPGGHLDSVRDLAAAAGPFGTFSLKCSWFFSHLPLSTERLGLAK